jgi:hypothetical protein
MLVYTYKAYVRREVRRNSRSVNEGESNGKIKRL